MVPKRPAVIHIGIGKPAIHVDAGVPCSIPVNVGGQACSFDMSDILVGRVEHVLTRWVLNAWKFCVGNESRDLFDAVTREAIAQGEVDVELRCEITVTKAERMALLAVKIGVSLIYACRIRVVEVGVEIPYSRTVYSHVITQSQV